MSEYLQDITINKLLENKKIQEASGKDIIKYPFENYNIPDDKWDEFVQSIKKDYKLDAIKENDIIYLRGTRNDLANFMMNELEIADTGILDYPVDDSDDIRNEKVAKEAEVIIDNLKKNLKHVNDYTFQISQSGTQININNRNHNTPLYNIDAYIKIEDGYYKLYASYKYDRAGYGYLGFSFRETDMNKFLEKTIKKLNQKFYPKEEPEKAIPKNCGKLTELDYNILNILDQLCQKYNGIVDNTECKCYEKNYTEGYLTKRCSFPYDPYCKYKFLSNPSYYHSGHTSKKKIFNQVIQNGENIIKDLEKAFNIRIKPHETTDVNDVNNVKSYVYEYKPTKELPIVIWFNIEEHPRVSKVNLDYKYQWNFHIYVYRSINNFDYKGY